ncbi:MAG: LPS export ABC transporter periplasmic protein LptC [Rickettsiales bacterium]|nr:LPS export ABC transporter periplasmic protein LptC [Rickettsiales bacterium]
MYKNRFKLFTKSFFFIVIATLVTILIISVFFNISNSVFMLEKVNLTKEKPDAGFTNVTYQMQMDEDKLFEIEADKAKQVTKNLVFFDKVKIKSIKGDINFSAEAQAGTFDEIIKLLIFNNDVKINYFNDFAESEEVKINIGSQEVTYPEFVRISSPEYHFTAEFLKYDVSRGQLVEARNSEYHNKVNGNILESEIILSDQENPNLLKASNVRITNNDIVLTGQDFQIALLENNIIEHINASGAIKMINPKYIITSEKLFYDPKNLIIQFRENVILKSESGEMVGDNLIYDINTDIAKFVNLNDKQIRAKLGKLD